MSTILEPRPAPMPGETVHLLCWRLFDYRGEQLTAGGLQRWLVEAARLLRSLGHPVVIHQRAERPFVKALEVGIVVRGHRGAPRATSTPWFNWRVHRQIPANAAVIYLAEDLAHPICRPRSLVVQHGIWWDGEYGWLRTRLAEFLARHAVRNTAGTVCVDTNFINWFRARWPEAGCDDRLHFLANFIDAEQWGTPPTAPAAAREGRITICFPRRSEPRRGIGLMAEVAPRLGLRYPDVDFRFVVGSGYHTDRLVEQLTRSPLLRDRWTVEALPMDAMRDAYERSQIVVIPTLCGEGTSLSAIEAMHFGCAVVSTWVGGLPNLIQDGENGLLTAPIAGQVEAALARLITDRELRCRIGANAQRSSLRFGIDRWRGALAGLMRERLGLGVAAEVSGG